MKAWLLKKIREDYIVQYTISGNIKMTSKDFLKVKYIDFSIGHKRKWFYEFVFANYVVKWYQLYNYNGYKNEFINKLVKRDTIRLNKLSVIRTNNANKLYKQALKKNKEVDIEDFDE
jgi:hypothetical protein